MTNTVSNSEPECLRLLQNGSQDALSKLYYVHVAGLRYYVLRMVKSPTIADDIVHDTFVKVWESRSQIDPEKPFKPFLYTIAKRHMLNLLKRAKHETSILDEIKKYTQFDENTTDLQMDFNESSALVNEAVNSLSGQCKEVFIQCRINGLTYKQAADKMGITESTVNKHMSRALILMRDYIKARQDILLVMAAIALIK